MDYTNHFIVTKRGTYICGCDAQFDNIDDAIYHYESGDIEGYCENGIRRNYKHEDVKKDEFECVCGKKADWYDISDGHFHIFKTTCMTERKRKEASYCEVCKLQCESVKNYQVHCMTQKHKENTGGRAILDLECKHCNIMCQSQAHARRHINTKKHKDMVASGTIVEPKISLHCETCKITCPSQKTMRAHLETKKHKKLLCINNIC